jgi:hypothetical protein
MSDQFFKPKPVSYGKKQKSERTRMYLISVSSLLIIFFVAWLIIIKFAASPFDKMEKYLTKKDIKKAALLNYEMLNDHPENRLAILMNGSVVNFALRELNITDMKLPFYEYDDFLKMEDRSGVFIKQAFSKKYSLFPDSPFFLNEFCNFSEFYPEALNNPEIMTIIKRSLQSQTKWNPGNENCMEILFSNISNYKDLTGQISGDNLSLREKPETKSKVLGKLKKGSRVLVKFTGFEETIGNVNGKWLYVLTRESVYGWVFGGYVEIR